MTTIAIDDLDPKLRELIERLELEGEPVAITRDGVQVAEITAARVEQEVEALDHDHDWSDEQWNAYWDARDTLAAEIGAAWPAGVSAVDAIREDRSRLDVFLARNGDRAEDR